MCMSAIEGTHIDMCKPDVCRCPMGRDQYFGAKIKMTQVTVWIVDAVGREMYATLGHPGSSNVAGIWLRDSLREKLEGGFLNDFGKVVSCNVSDIIFKHVISPCMVYVCIGLPGAVCENMHTLSIPYACTYIVYIGMCKLLILMYQLIPYQADILDV
jgi:hypothetical protein